jgi:hypothetical protein
MTTTVSGTQAGASGYDDDDGVVQAPAGKGQGDFFAVDRRAWARACGLGLNPAVAYLVLARGTGADNRATTWSVQAVEKYTSVSRGRAHEALKALRRAGLVQVLREGTRPKYRLVPAHEVPGCEGHPPPALDDAEQRLFDQLARGESWVSGKGGKTWDYRNPRTVAKALVAKGWARELGGNRFAPIPHDLDAAARPDWIWLPNELVTGAADETPPVELVRQAQDVMTLRLLVDLYHAQNLREDGGVSRQLMWRKHERVEVGHQAQFTVWGFRYKGGSVTWSGPTACHRREKLTEEEKAAGKNAGVDFFRREGQLTRLGLLEWVPHLVEGAGPEAEVIHPLGHGGTEGLENLLGAAAEEAAAAMLTEGQHAWALENDLWLAPVPRHIAEVQLVGVARLRYRPRTRMTAAWWADLQAKGERHLACYRGFVEAGTEAEAMSA